MQKAIKKKYLSYKFKNENIKKVKVGYGIQNATTGIFQRSVEHRNRQ